MGRPSSRRQVIFGLGTPLPLHVNVVFDPSGSQINIRENNQIKGRVHF